MHSLKRPMLLLILTLLFSACSTNAEQSPTETARRTTATRVPTQETTMSPTVVPSPTSNPATATAVPTATIVPPTPTPGGTMATLLEMAELQDVFNQDQGLSRIVLLLSTGCPTCLAGADRLEENLLAPNPDLPLRVYAVWFGTVGSNLLPPDLSGRRPEDLLTDPRVVHLWDPERLVSQWFADNVALQGPERASVPRTFGDLQWGNYVWDSVFLYGPDATWEEANSPALAGYPIIQQGASIRDALDVATEVTNEGDSGGAAVYVIDPAQSLVTYGVRETLVGQRVNYAIGVTNQVSGTIRFDPENPAASEVSPIMVNIQSLQSDNFLRDQRIQQEFLESAQFPLATFTPTELRSLPESYTPGETVTFEMVGDLEVRDTVVPTTFTVEAMLENGMLSGTATTQLLMTDFGFDPPAITDLIAAENEVDITFDFVAAPER